MGQGIEQTGEVLGSEKRFWRKLRDRYEDWEASFVYGLRNVIKFLRNTPETYMVTADEETLASWDERESERGAGQHRTYPVVLGFRMSRYNIIQGSEDRVICLTRMELNHAVRVLMREVIDYGMILEIWEERG